MTCSNCRTLNPPGATHCAICGRPLPVRKPGPRRGVSPYQGVHTPTGPEGRAIRGAWLDFGPNPWVNVVIGVSICLAFAASALPAVVREHSRVPSDVREPRIVFRDDGPYVRFFVRDVDGHTLAVEGDLDITIYGPGLATTAGVEANLAGQYTMQLRRSDFHSVMVRGFSLDRPWGVTRELLAEVGPLDLGATGAGAVGPIVRVGVRLTTALGGPMEAYSSWLDMSHVTPARPGGARG